MKLSTDISAVITGGASGLGEATARAMAAKGVKVGIFDMNEDRGKTIATEIGGVFAKVNVADEASVDTGFKAVRAVNGTERILVNCAGIGLGMKTAGRKRDTGEISPMMWRPISALSISTFLGVFFARQNPPPP